MKNADFEPFADTSAGRRAATLLRTHKVTPKQIFATVFTEVTQALPHLVEGAKYTTEMLCGPTIWSAWFTAEGCAAGMCLAYMVRKNLVDLSLHKTRSGKGSKRYCKRVRNAPAVWDSCDAAKKNSIDTAIGRFLVFSAREKMLPLLGVNPEASDKLDLVLNQ